MKRYIIVGILFFIVHLPGAHAQTAAEVGKWTTLSYTIPLNPIHTQLLRNGKILVLAGSSNDPTLHDENIFQAAVFDWRTGQFTTQDLLWDVFCNGMAALPDGRVLIIGGTIQYDPFYGERRATIYNPTTNKFAQTASMQHGRWYATGTVLGDGGILAFSGLNEINKTNVTTEVYRIGSGWSSARTSPFTPPLYPWLHLLPDGRVFFSGSIPQSHIFDPATRAWTLNVAQTQSRVNRYYGSSVLLPLDPTDGYRPRVMIFGGHDRAVRSTEIIDLSQAPPAWGYGPAMSGYRIQMHAVLLPNGKVLAHGGSVYDEDENSATRTADLFDPVTETQSSGGTATYPRLYHSVSLLLPDATVWVAGSNPLRGTYEPHMEIYSPPYLFTRDATGTVIQAPRPVITSMPNRVGYGVSFYVYTPQFADIATVALARLGSSTHAWDSEQRLIRLRFTKKSALAALRVTAPPQSNIAPPGYYMLFILDRYGVPAQAKIIQLDPAPRNLRPTAKITAPNRDVTIRAGQAVTFAGTGSDPDGDTVSYAWEFPGGTPDRSNVQNPGSITFNEAGIYVVSLTVLDGQGTNDPSPPTRTIRVIP